MPSAVQKKVDSRVRTLIENGVATKTRSLFVIVGDRGRDQVVNLHYLLGKTQVRARPSVLWCYKKELGFSSNRLQRMKTIKKKMSRGVYDTQSEDPFELFVSSTQIRYTQYHETQKILGNTYGMCVLQDFEALTPNLLARTIETVEGGGLVIILLKTMSSLRQLYSMTMDVHARFRSEHKQEEVKPRFNERFLLSLATCSACLVVDDELNVLPISSHSRQLVPVEQADDDADAAELQRLKESMADSQPIGSLVDCAKTLDQARALLVFIEGITDKTLRSTVALTAARGRGKSAALGLGMATAVALGYANVFVTSPSPENLKTLFEFVLRGFDALGFKEHMDYELIQSSHADHNKAVVRINIFRGGHRQTVQYIEPHDHRQLAQAELLVIDEAAAIPLPYVRRLLGPYLVFMASTVNGYEGTGRSLSLKLLSQLRKQKASSDGSGSSSVLREITLDEPIRYARGDTVELWLNKLLCLDAATIQPLAGIGSCPHPSDCQLYYVERDTLFSFHRNSEDFLQRLVALFVSSHYKNTPNDLMLMSDAPMHRLFVLLGPVDRSKNQLPEILAAVQVALEGGMAMDSTRQFNAGDAGDLIPWTLSQQYQDLSFIKLDGARIVRIATHPDYQSMGYGSRCMELLARYYQGDICNLDERSLPSASSTTPSDSAPSSEVGLLKEKLKPRSGLPPLLVRLEERPAELLHYLGVSYGMTAELFRFWRRAGFTPLYLRQTPNEVTGEHTCVMVKALSGRDDVSGQWLGTFSGDFHHRLVSLLGSAFRPFSAATALQILDCAASTAGTKGAAAAPLRYDELLTMFSVHDLKRLQSYVAGTIDYHVIVDLVPLIARGYFERKFGSLTMSPAQESVLLSLGLQYKSVTELESEMNIKSHQVLALFGKAMRRVCKHFSALQEDSIAATLPAPLPADSMKPLAVALDDELADASDQALDQLKEKQASSLLKVLGAERFAIQGDDQDWDQALQTSFSTGGRLQIKRSASSSSSSSAAAAKEKPTGRPKQKKQHTGGKKQRRR